MAHILFYEKPGCAGNARQKQLLRKAGHRLEVRDLLSCSWTAEALLAFLKPLAVTQWFNPSAPAVKSGEIDPGQLEPGPALALLLERPLLIRRPLMLIEGQHFVGFDTEQLATWLPDLSGDYESCPALHEPCQFQG